MPTWTYYVHLALNMLIIPLLGILWQIKISLTKLETLVTTHHGRIDRLERAHDNEDDYRRRRDDE